MRSSLIAFTMRAKGNRTTMQQLLDQAVSESLALLPSLRAMGPKLTQLGELLLNCWEGRGKVLIAGNGGSLSDAMHFAEELSVRFKKNRRALAAIALCDPAAITCAGNDFGYESVFERQVEALGNPGDVLVVFTTSGNSKNILRAVDLAKSQKLKSVAFLGNTGGAAAGRCDLEFIIPSNSTARIQEAHKLLFHTACEWIDSKV
ncbi:SIS domain-containing protein [soil metagenome]